MGWPTTIQLYNSEHSVAYNGTELRETWYVEPFDAAPAFISSMLGEVMDGIGNLGTVRDPAAHYIYPHCFATACEVVPFDNRSFSFMGRTDYEGQNQPATQDTVKHATQRYKSLGINPPPPNAAEYLDPKADSQYRIVSGDNSTKTAGAFITVTYLPALFYVPRTDTTTINNQIDRGNKFQTGVNLKLAPQLRDNVINAGLKLITPPMAINLWGASGLFYPASGMAPVLKEQFSEVIVERRMLPTSFNLSLLSTYINKVNQSAEGIAPIDSDGAVTSPIVTANAETMRFAKYSTVYVVVPTVDNSGEPNGFNRWLNIELHYDWRNLVTTNLHLENGLMPVAAASVTWNHILAYPGTLSWLNGNAGLGGVPSGLSWYRAKFSADHLGADTDPYHTTVEVFKTMWGPF